MNFSRELMEPFFPNRRIKMINMSHKEPPVGVWEWITDIMTTSTGNDTACMCSDLQTDDYSPLYAWYNYILIIVALPTLSVFGVCTNIVNIFIYSRKRLRNSANTYLLFLACSDFLVILTGLFIFWIDSARSYIPELARAPYTTVYTLPFGYMAQSCSIYFTVAAAFDCYINVCWKKLAISYCSVKKAKQICSSIVFVSIVYNSLRFPQFNLRKCYHEVSQETIIEICPTTLFFTINIVYNVYMYMVLMTLLPFLFLLILNAFIVVRQSLAQKNIYQVNDEKKEESVEKEEGTDDTITMIMVVVLFLACNTLALFVNVFETFFEPDPLVLNLMSDASNFLVVFNSSVNCVIYFIFNTEYREVFIIHAQRMKTTMKEEYCCCFGKRRQTEYQPVTVIQTKISQPSIQINGTNRTPPRLALGDDGPDSPVWQPLTSRKLPGLEGWNALGDDGPDSPVWQPLTSRKLPGLEGWNGSSCFDPSEGTEIYAMDEDRDSGWDDGTSNREIGRTRRWIAEVKIMEGESIHRPHIVVKPLSDRDCLSITTL